MCPSALPPTQPLLSYHSRTLPGATLSSVLITHRHWDHIGGLDELHAASGPTLSVVAPDAPDIPHVTHAVSDGDTIELHF